jgi:hypothetical protein
MSQVKRYASGTGSDGIQPATPVSQLAFKVNGNEYKLDEQALRDKFNPIFDDLVKKGEAHERDRDKWLASNEQILKNARGGTYDLSSSSGQLYNEHYTGDASKESLGVNADGTSARKTVLGNFLARGHKSDAQRVAMLNHYLGNSIVSGYDQNQADLKRKAQEQADKDKLVGQDHAQNILTKAMSGYGEGTYGKDFTDNPDLIYSKWFGKEQNNAQRYSTLRSNYQSRYDNLFNPELDKYKDYLKGKGYDIDALREKAGSYYDSSSKTFKGKYARIGDLLNLSNPFDTMGIDNTFIDKSAYDKSRAPAATVAGTTPGTSAPSALKQHGDYWTDGTHYWQDKDRKILQKGFGKDNLLYGDDGTPFRGWYLHNGNPDSPFTGWYDSGKQGDVTAGKNYMAALGKSPANTQRLSELSKQYSQIVGAYDSVLNDDHWLTAGEAPKDDATYNVWAGPQASGKQFAKTADITAKFQGLGSKANIQAYTTQQQNAYGRSRIFHMVTLPNHKQYYGSIQTDPLNGVTGMLDPNGKAISDPELINALKGTTYIPDAKNDNWKNTSYTGTGPVADNSLNAAAQRATQLGGIFKEGGIVEHQAGGTIASNTLLTGATAPAKDDNQHQVTVADIGKSISDPNYHISGADKAEIAALGLNLGSLATSIFGGGGAGLAAGLGAAGTLTQLGADYSKHGFKWGDAGAAALGLGLDATAILPGLGVLSEGAKIGKNLARVSRVLVPAMTAFGLHQAAGVVMDIASGKKHVKDLNIDDMRALTNGITAVIGGARSITQRVGTKVTNTNSIALADGKTLDLDEAGVAAIKNAEDPIAAAKSVAERLGIENPELATKKVLSKQGWNPLKGWTKEVPDASVITQKGARVAKAPEDVQGTGLFSNYERWAAQKAAARDLNGGGSPYAVDPKYKLNLGGDVEQTTAGAPAQKTWSTFGDYWNKPDWKGARAAEGEDLGSVVGARRESTGTYNSNPGEPTYEYTAGKTATVGDIPDTRRIYGSMFGMRSLDGERKVSYEQIRNRLRGVSGTRSSKEQLSKFMEQKFDDGSFARQVQDQIKEAVSNPGARGYLKFKQGGILKAQDGAYIPYPMRVPSTNSNSLNLASGFGVGYTPYPFRVPTKASTEPSYWNSMSALKVPSVSTVPTSTTSNAGDVAPGANKFSLPKFSMNTNTLSELGRALYTSQLNKQIDTRVERPMLSAPQEVPIAVRGNLYGQSVANTQADNLVRDSQSFKTSDGSLQMLGNLEAQRNASQIRMQGAQQNIAAIEQSRQQSQQSAMQNAQVRANVANENIQTNARATQGERQAENEKHAQVNQPLLNFWRDENYKNYALQQQNKAIDTQIGGLGEEAKVRSQQQQLSQDMYKVWNDASIPEDQRQSRYQQLSNQSADLQNRLTNRLLLLRKNPYQHFSNDAQYYNLNSSPSYKEGGAVRVQIQEAKDMNASFRETAKEGNDANKESMQDQTKRHLEAMREINDMIKLALK